MATVAEEQVAFWLGGRSFASWRDEFDRRGYLIFERVLPQDGVAEIRAALAPHLARDLKGRNDFEGVKTNRVYALSGLEDDRSRPGGTSSTAVVT